MIQGSTQAATRMVLRLHTDIKWCVTGTPLGTGKMADLIALMGFLNQYPLNDKIRWQRLIGNGSLHYSRQILLSVCKQLMLRRSKKVVESELQLPPQREVLTLLRFNSVEVFLKYSVFSK